MILFKKTKNRKSVKTSKPFVGKHRRLVLQAVPVLALALLSLVVFRYGFSSASSRQETFQYRIVPEYKRTMKKVLVSFSTGQTDLEFHQSLFSHLPKYTEIIMLMPRGSSGDILKHFKELPDVSSIRLVGFDPENVNGRVFMVFPEREKLVDFGPLDGQKIPQGSMWAQDLFEVATNKDGQTVLLISDVYKWFKSKGGQAQKVISDNNFLAPLRSIGLEVTRLPLTFKGGNILIDEINGQRIALCGGDVLRQTRTVWKATRNSTPTDDQITNLLKKHLYVDKVVVVGKDKIQPSLMFHLDQAMVFLAGGQVGLTQIIKQDGVNAEISPDIAEVESFLVELKAVLIDLGYKIIDIKTSLHNVRNFQFYVNGVPYVNAVSGKNTFLMPVFPDSKTGFDRQIIRENVSAIKSAGYIVSQVPVLANKINGGLHCMVNVVE